MNLIKILKITLLLKTNISKMRLLFKATYLSG